MTIFDDVTDRYLEQLGVSRPGGDWNDVLSRARRKRRSGRLARAGVAGAVVSLAAVAALAGFGTGGFGGRSILDKAEAALLTPLRAAPGTIEHILVQYRTDSGTPFIEYETWLAADGTWCRRTMEGIPGRATADTRLTECRSSSGAVELYLPSTNEILRVEPTPAASGSPSTRAESRVPVAVDPGTPPITVRALDDGTIAVEQSGEAMTAAEINALSERERRGIKAALARVGQARGARSVDPGPSPDWLTEDVVDAFRRQAVREAGTMTLDGREYAKLVTDDGLDAVLVDSDSGEAVAWIPSPGAFGVPTTVVRTRETLPDDARARRSFSLVELHPDAVVRSVSAAELSGALASQFPRG